MVEVGDERRLAQRALVRRGCVGVGIGDHRPVAGDHAVPPTAFVLACCGEVQGHRGRMTVDTVGLGLELVTDARMHRSAAAVGQTFVRGLLAEGVDESVLAFDVGFDEGLEATPALGLFDLWVVQHAGKECCVDPGAQHRCLAEQHAIGGIQQIDARHQQRLDRLGQILDGPGDPRSSGQFVQEQRVAATTLVERATITRVDAVAEQRVGQLRGVVATQSGKAQALGAGRTPLVPRPHAEHPRAP